MTDRSMAKPDSNAPVAQLQRLEDNCYQVPGGRTFWVVPQAGSPTVFIVQIDNEHTISVDVGGAPLAYCTCENIFCLGGDGAGLIIDELRPWFSLAEAEIHYEGRIRLVVANSHPTSSSSGVDSKPSLKLVSHAPG